MIRFVRVVAALVAAAALGGCAWLLPQTEAVRSSWPAGLDERAELGAVPFFPQTDYQCGPAALATVLAFDGLPVTPEDLVSKVYVPARKGSLQVEMLAAPRSYGIVSWQVPPRLEAVLRQIDAGLPVVVLQDYGVWPFHVWHYAVVVGYDRETGKLVMRSGEKKRLEMPFPVLEYTWKKSDYWAMVGVPPDRIAPGASETDWVAAVAAMERVASRTAARTAYRTLLARWPSSLNGTIGLANVDYAEGDLGSSEQLLRSAVEHHPESVAALNNLAQVLADRSRPEEALQVIGRAIALGGPLQAAAEQTRAQIREKFHSPPSALPDTPQSPG